MQIRIYKELNNINLSEIQRIFSDKFDIITTNLYGKYAEVLKILTYNRNRFEEVYVKLDVDGKITCLPITCLYKDSPDYSPRKLIREI